MLVIGATVITFIHGIEYYDGCTVSNYPSTKNITDICSTPANQTAISFQHSKMDALPDEIFTSYPVLKVLNASSVELKHINNTRFGHLPELGELDLSNNSLASWPERIFEKCNIVTLFLHHNRLSDLDTYAFYGLSKLQRLDLSYNSIAKLEEGVFNPLINLDELHMEFNHIQVVDKQLFAHNTLLRQLYVQNNSIDLIDASAFNSLAILSTLQIDNNLLVSINLTAIKQLLNVSIDNCHLKTLALPDSVREVRAYGNRISVINATAESNLTRLLIGNNSMTSLRGLSKCKKLQHLDVSYNPLKQLDLDEMANLKDLVISGIKLDKLDADSWLHRLPQLHAIKLSPQLYAEDKINAFLHQLDPETKVSVLDESGRLLIGKSVHKPATQATIIDIIEPVQPVTTTQPSHSTATLDRDAQNKLIGRIERLEKLMQSYDEQRVDLQHNKAVEASLHTLRVLVVITMSVLSFVGLFQLFAFVRRNYTRFHGQTTTMFSIGRARSHEPMLEEVL